ncbi:MAG: hypothetical protein AAFY19_04130 [Pseudomonadota bacterium]
MNGRIIGQVRTPWHLWVVGVLSLLFFAGGANDYIQIKLDNADYIAQTASNLGASVAAVNAYFAEYPLWANVFWAFGVWGAVAGAILILLRSRFAFHALLLSLSGLVVNTLYRYQTPFPSGGDEPAMSGTVLLVFSAVIWLSVILAAAYARAMTRAGVLR